MEREEQVEMVIRSFRGQDQRRAAHEAVALLKELPEDEARQLINAAHESVRDDQLLQAATENIPPEEVNQLLHELNQRREELRRRILPRPVDAGEEA